MVLTPRKPVLPLNIQNNIQKYTKTYAIATLRVEIGLGHNNFIYLLYLQNNLLLIIFKLQFLQSSLRIYI